MNRLIYRLMYIFSHPRWDTGRTPPEVVEAFEQGGIPAGPALDLGCGTGTNAIFMARHGHDVIGLDFTPEAIGRARRKVAQAGLSDHIRLQVADVTRLAELDIPQLAFALDVGCFHGLSPEGRQRYADALAARLEPGGRYMIFTLDPHAEGSVSFGLSAAQVREIFSPAFDLTRQEHGSTGDRGSTWTWLTRRA